MDERINQYLPWLASLPFFLAGVTADATYTLRDVFPLSRGQHTIYQYTEDYTSWFYSSSTSVRDSGLVEYVVLDSVQANDTTIVWSIMEEWQFTHRVRTSFPPTDTTFIVHDSSNFSLTEFTTGKHELRGTSRTWGFPALGPTSVFRFSDSSQAAFMIHIGGCMHFIPANYDSLRFVSDSGLVTRASSMCVDFDEQGWAYWRDSRLLSRTVVSVEEPDPVPKHSRLVANYPNPFNPSTTIDYQIANGAHVTLKVFDVLGREMAILVNEAQEPGYKSVRWNAGNVTSGVYFYQLRAGDFVQTRKMLLMR